MNIQTQYLLLFIYLFNISLIYGGNIGSYFTVYLGNNGDFKLSPGKDIKNGLAYGRFNDLIDSNGWGELWVSFFFCFLTCLIYIYIFFFKIRYQQDKEALMIK